MTWSGRRSFAGIVVCVALGVASPAAASGGGGTPLPHVTGPLPVTATSYPFGAADHTLVPEDLAKVGYVEDEYLVSGKANVYTWPAPVRPWCARPTRRTPRASSCAGPRRRRASAATSSSRCSTRRTSSTSTSAGRWRTARWSATATPGSGITDKPIDVLALKKFDPARYGSLSFANPLALDDPRNCLNPVTSVDPPTPLAEHRGRARLGHLQPGRRAGAQPRRANPLAYGGRPPRRRGRRRPRRSTGEGRSTSTASATRRRAATCTTTSTPSTRSTSPATAAPDLRRLHRGRGRRHASWASCRSTSASHPPRVGDPRLQFSNVGVPIIHVMSQSDYLFGIDARRPDSDAPADRYRHYEMAGAAHATPDELNFSATSADIVKAGVAVPPMNCNEGPRSRFPSRIFFDAMLRNLDRGCATGSGRRTPTRSTVADDHAWRARQFGNVVGGLRSPYLDVPTSTWFGNSTGASFCIIAGHEVPFDAARLQAALPDPRRLRPRGGQGHGAAGGRALHHRLRRPRPDPRRRRRPTSRRAPGASNVGLPMS